MNEINVSTHQCKTCHEQSPLLSYLTDDERRTVEKTRLTVSFRKGETIKKQGTFLSHVLIVSQGLAKVYLEGSDQRNSIIRIVKPVQFVGGPGIYLDRIHHYSVSALVETTVCFFDAAVFKEIADNNRSFAHQFLKDFSQNVLSVYNRLVNLTFKQMPGRMADALLYLTDEIFESTHVPMVFSRVDLAELSGMSKDSAIKTLRDFQQDGIIEINDHELLILNRETLVRISKTG